MVIIFVLIFPTTEIFNRALSLMNQAVSGTLQPGARENIAYLTSTERRSIFDTSFLYSNIYSLGSIQSTSYCNTKCNVLMSKESMQLDLLSLYSWKFLFDHYKGYVFVY